MTDVLLPSPDRLPPASLSPTVDAPATALAGTVADALVIAVAPSTGRFRPEVGREAVLAGTAIGHVTGGKERADAVVVPVDSTLSRLLVRPGQLVTRGQGIAWLQRCDVGEGR
jgi:hypothetical protein